MRILIIGGTQFIGPHVVRELTGGGHEVAVFHRGKSQTDLPGGVHSILGDRRQLQQHQAELLAFKAQVVLDMIAYVEQDAATLMEVFSGRAERVVGISSMDVYRAYGRIIGTEPGSPDPLPLNEASPVREKRYPYRKPQPRPADDPQRWMDDYDKIPVEQAFLSRPELPGTVLRLPAVYGPGDQQHRLYPYLKRMDDRRPFIYLGEGLSAWRWTRGYVEDVAAAIALAVTSDRAAGQVYNVGEAEALSEGEWVSAIGQAAGWSGQVIRLPDDELPTHLRFDADPSQSLVGDTNKIRRELGWSERIDRPEALLRTIPWERDNPPEPLDPQAFDYAAEDALIGKHRASP